MIAIKSMENIPRSCIECPLRMLDKCYHLKSACELNGFDIFEERPKGCPLVEIVTCKDCKYWNNDGNKTTCDKNIGHGFPEDYFCGNGERKK